METKDKSRLFIDLCAKYPYGVIVKFENKNLCIDDIRFYEGDFYLTLTDGIKKYINVNIERVIPYMKSMKNMSDADKIDYLKTFNKFSDEIGTKVTYPSYPSIDWLNANHYDFRNFIEDGLVLDAPKDLYK